MGNLENSEDPDEIHQGLHCLLTLKQPSGTEKHHDLGKLKKNVTKCDIGVQK